MSDLEHNIVSLLYSIKGLSESHLIRAEEGRFGDTSDRFLHAEAILKKVHCQSQKALDITQKIKIAMKMVEKERMGEREKADQEEDSKKRGKTDLKNAWCEAMKSIHKGRCAVRIEILERIPENFPAVNVSQKDLKEILYHLIKNAIQAMQSESLENGAWSLEKNKLIIRAATGFNSKEEKVALIQVIDTGPGIPPEDLSRVFQPFFSTKPYSEGNGLGLYLTKLLVEKNKGRISVSSFPGAGACFQLEFLLI